MSINDSQAHDPNKVLLSAATIRLQAVTQFILDHRGAIWDEAAIALRKYTRRVSKQGRTDPDQIALAHQSFDFEGPSDQHWQFTIHSFNMEEESFVFHLAVYNVWGELRDTYYAKLRRWPEGSTESNAVTVRKSSDDFGHHNCRHVQM
jgi:hypothetical protein